MRIYCPYCGNTAQIETQSDKRPGLINTLGELAKSPKFIAIYLTGVFLLSMGVSIYLNYPR